VPSNTNLTVDWIGNEALRLAHEKLSFIGTINREFDSSFRPGYGNTIRIRIPSQYTVTTGRVIDVQDGVQQSTNITVATQKHVALRYNSQEMSQDLVNFQKLHLEPAMAILASDVEADVINGCSRATYNIVTTSTATAPINNLSLPGLARARLNQHLAPGNARAIQMDSVTMGELVNGVAAYFNPSNAISNQYREGLVARTAMADYYESDRTFSMGNATVSTNSQVSTYTFPDGAVSAVISTNIVAPTAGQTFTIGGVFAVHPETKAAYSHLQTFACLAGSTSTVILFTPAMRMTGARKNVGRSDGTNLQVSSLTTAPFVFTGNTGSTYIHQLMYHRDAFTFATAALPMMDDAIRCVVKTYDGISLRVWEASDIRNDEKLTRIDILYGYSAIRPQWAVRLQGTGV
jgi:hypothetical protein